MNRSGSRWRVLVVDLIGGAFMLACVGGVAWFALLRDDDTAAELARLNRQIETARRALAEIRSDRDRERVVLRERERQLSESGALPDRAPVEQYFQTLSSIAKRTGLQVLRQSPLTHRTYPGLLERRYAYEVSGAMLDIERFLVEIEQTEFWADVGFLKIAAAGSGGGLTEHRIASMTISVFSALPSDPEPERG